MKKKNYRSFEEARKFVISKSIKSSNDWRKYSKSGKRPDDIPGDPATVYKKDGTWKGWGNFLGTGMIAYQNREYKSFEDARKFVHKLGLKNRDEWRVFCKSGEKPDDIPNYPAGVYKNKGWKNLGDWLGTGMIAYQNREYKSFEDARKFVRSLKLSGRKEWREYIKSGQKPDDIPSKPDGTYKKEWKDLGDFLGTGNVSGINRHKQFRSFQQARKFVRSLKLKSQPEWNAYRISGKKPDDIPSKPDGTYKKEWTTWGDWFGTGRVANQNRQFRSFTEARKFVRSLKLKDNKEWKVYCKSEEMPDDIPSNPNLAYKEFMGLGDWLDTDFIAYRDREYLPIIEAKIEARKVAKELGIKTMKDWSEAYSAGQIPKNLPSSLWNVYKRDGATKKRLKEKSRK